MDKYLIKYLNNHKIEYMIHRHKAVFTVEESHELKKTIPGLHCKTLFVKDNNDKFYLIGMPAQKRLDSNKFKEKIKAKKIRFATPEELKEKTNLIPGSVSIFGAIYIKDNTSLVLDKDVWDAETVGFHPNENTSTLEITHENLKRFYNSLDCNKQVLEI